MQNKNKNLNETLNKQNANIFNPINERSNYNVDQDNSFEDMMMSSTMNKSKIKKLNFTKT